MAGQIRLGPCGLLSQALVGGQALVAGNSNALANVKQGAWAFFLLMEGDEQNYLILETYDQQTQQPYADNSTFESDAGFGTTSTTDDILDFTERNPFGEVDEGF